MPSGNPGIRRPEQSARQRIDPGVAVTEMKAHGYIPLVPYPGTDQPWLCVHDACGRECPTPTRSNILAGQGGCRKCGDEEGAAKRRYAFKKIEKMFEDRGFTLTTTDYKSSGKPMPCVCDECGKPNNISYSDIRSGHGCRYCNNRFYSDKPTMVYLVKNPTLGALKVGITLQNPVKMWMGKHQRIREHELSGFDVVKTWDFDTGEPAWNVEQEVLRHWREDLGAPEFVTPEQMCHHGRTCCAGHTETASTRKVGLRRTIDYIEELAA